MVTSLRFQRPRITLSWLLALPVIAVLGLACLTRMALHEDVVFAP